MVPTITYFEDTMEIKFLGKLFLAESINWMYKQ